MPIETVSDLVQFLTRYPLLEPVQRDELDWLLKARFTDPRTLAKELLLREWLTPYQVNQVLQGHGTDLMLGSYLLLERLTEGALGQLFKARHLHMKRTVALQVVRPELLKDPLAVEHFYGEIQAVSQLSHQHLVAAYDAGPIGNTHFFAMEYVEGIDLERQIQYGGPLAVDQACEFIRQTALGLQHAFERGLLHHDLRPANLLVTRSGERASRERRRRLRFAHLELRAGQGPQPRLDPDPPAYQAHPAAGRRLPGHATPAAGLPRPGTAARRARPATCARNFTAWAALFISCSPARYRSPAARPRRKFIATSRNCQHRSNRCGRRVRPMWQLWLLGFLPRTPMTALPCPEQVADALSPDPPAILDSIAAPPTEIGTRAHDGTRRRLADRARPTRRAALAAMGLARRPRPWREVCS